MHRAQTEEPRLDNQPWGTDLVAGKAKDDKAIIFVAVIQLCKFLCIHTQKGQGRQSALAPFMSVGWVAGGHKAHGLPYTVV